MSRPRRVAISMMVPIAYFWQRGHSENPIFTMRERTKGTILLSNIVYGKAPSGSSAINDGAYSLMVKLRSVAAAIRVQFPLGTPC